MPDDRRETAPTREMIAAGVRALAPLWDMQTDGEMAEIARDVFAAMIAADVSTSLVSVSGFAGPHVPAGDYVAHFGAHAHGFIMPDGSFGSGGLTLIPVR